MSAKIIQIGLVVAAMAMVIGGSAAVVEGIRQIRNKDQAVIQVSASHLTWNGRAPLQLGWADFGEANIRVVMTRGINSVFLRLLPGPGLRKYRDLYLNDIDVNADQLISIINQVKKHGPSALVNQSAMGRAQMS